MPTEVVSTWGSAGSLSPAPSPFQKHLVKSWWVLAFALVCVVGHDQALRARDRELVSLESKRTELLAAAAAAVEEQKDLQLQIASQSDPAWIELTLMKGLGLVPEGATKVFFTPLADE